MRAFNQGQSVKPAKPSYGTADSWLLPEEIGLCGSRTAVRRTSCRKARRRAYVGNMEEMAQTRERAEKEGESEMTEELKGRIRKRHPGS